MNILKGTHNIEVFDNSCCKPPNLGDGPNSKWSMMVLFSAHGTILSGQYAYADCEWHVHIGSYKIGARIFGRPAPVKIEIPHIPDYEVEYWFFCPGHEDLMQDCIRTEQGNGHKMKCRNSGYDHDNSIGIKDLPV